MSEREGFRILDSQNAAAVGCNYKVEEAARPCPQILPRRKLTDISNLPQTGKPSIQGQKSQSIPTTTKEYIEQLQKENLALAKILTQRNKIIEQTGIELQRLRSNLIKMRDQNQQLALSHTHMLAELNLGKDRLKALQHELGCKNGLLQARNSKLDVNLIKEDEPTKEGEDHKMPRNAKKRLRSLSLGSSEQLQSEDNVGNRLPVRRQSARFKAVIPDGDSLFETDDSKCILPDGTAPSTSVDASANNEDHVANRPRSSVRRQSARFKTISPCPLSDETVQETNASTSVETSVISEGHAVQRPSVRRQSSRSKTVPPCPLSDETVQENNGSTSDETSVIIEGHAAQRPSMRRQSTRYMAKTPKQADDPSEMDDTVSTNCSFPDEPIPENGSTSVETSVINEGHAVQRPSARRQAIRCKAKTPKQADDQSEMDDSIPTNCLLPDEPIPENASTSVEKLVKSEFDSRCSGQRRESQESREPSLDRPSLGRPSRVAARKVQTYKEVSLRVKMRRLQ